MLRIIGAILLTICSTAVGALYAKRLRLRCDELTNIIKMVDIIEGEIGFNARSIAQIFEELKASHLAKTCKLVSVCDGKSGEEVAKNILKNKKLLPLEPDDIKSICSFLETLGKSDTSTEVNRCKMQKSTLKMHLDEALQTCKNKTKLCYTLGLFAGLTVSALVV